MHKGKTTNITIGLFMGLEEGVAKNSRYDRSFDLLIPAVIKFKDYFRSHRGIGWGSLWRYMAKETDIWGKIHADKVYEAAAMLAEEIRSLPEPLPEFKIGHISFKSDPNLEPGEVRIVQGEG